MILKIAVLILTLSLPLFASEHFSLSNRYLPPALPHPQQKFFSRIPLDPAEVDFLNSIDHIRMCVDPDWMPYDHIDDHGKYLGINADFHAVFRQRIGKPIRVVKTNSWNLSLDYIKRRQCDILSSAVLTEERKPFLAFTRPFNTSPIVIATRTDRQPIQYLEDVPGESFAMVKGHAVIDMLAKKHPGIRIVQTAHARSGLEMVARGDVFGYLDTAATIGYQIQKHGLPNIRISGMTQESYAMSVAVRNDQPLLLGIFDKAVASLSESDKQAILNQWISVRFEQTIDYTQTWKVLISIAILLFLMAVREYIVSKYKARLVALNKELEQLSKTDSLTGIANRHLLNHVLHEEIARSQRYHSKFSIIMLDVDHFKSINDHFGHSEGDHILQSIAGCIADSTRVNDTAGRWGGEEFLILCPGTDLNGAVQLAEAMRQTIECHDFGLPSCVTVSLGVAEHHDNQSLESFIRLVDNALYEAKNEGRNQVKTVTL